MPDTTLVTAPAPRKRHRLLRTLLWIVGVFIILLVVVYFVATSSAFLQAVILPRASKSLNAKITVSDASISPFKEIILHNLKVQTTGEEPLVTAPEVRVRYHLMNIIGGNIDIDEVALSSPTINLVENADGTSNLDPLLKSQKEKSKEKKPSEAKASKPTRIDLKKFALSGATIRKVKNYPGGNRDVSELSNVNVTLSDLKNGQTGKLTLDAAVKIENHPPAPGTNGVLQAGAKGSFEFTMTADLKPASIKGNTHLEVASSEGAFAELAGLGADLDCDATPTEIRQAGLRFQKGGTGLGQLRISGPFDMAKTEGRLAVEILSIDKQVLNLVGAKSGMDFGTTTINSKSEIQLEKAGALITATGQFNADKFQVIRANETSPPLDFHAQYNVTVDRAAGNAVVKELTLTGTQKGAPLLRTELSSPMTLAWGNAANSVGDSALNLTLTSLDLADWKPFLGGVAQSGKVNAAMKLVSQQGGKQLTFDVSSQIENLTAGAGSNQITQANVTLQANGNASDLKQFNLTQYKIQLSQQSQSLLTVSGAGTYDKTTGAADMQVAVQAVLSRLLQIKPQPNLNASSGTAELNGHVMQKEGTQTITGKLVLADLTGHSGKNVFNGFGATIDLDITKTPQQIQIRKAAGKLTEGGNAGGSFDISGTYDSVKKSAQLTAKLTDFNQNGLRPFLEPMLAEKKLVSVAFNGNASAQYNPEGDSAMKADLQVANLVVSDPRNQTPATPLEAKLQIDASVQKQIADVRQFQITLTPTARAKNELRLTGRVDLSNTNATQGSLRLDADALDLTGYYDLFASKTKAAQKKTATRTAPAQTTTPAPAAADANQEPEAKNLPFHNFTAEVNIGHVYLREVEITTLQTTAKIDGGHVLLNPFKLALNGAPVSASVNLDMGVPGYKYDTSFSAQAVPLAPLMNTFAPERKGEIAGTMTAQAKITGTGITGASLKKNLAGQFDITSTNLNLSVVNIKSPLLKTLINVISLIPDLLRKGDVTTLIGGVTGSSGGGLADELKKAPVQSINAKGVAGSGRVDLQQASVQSSAFLAEAVGTVTLADVLTNSAVKIPVTVSLSQPILQQINLVPANTPTNAPYAKLPDFFTITGTVGKPKENINKVALAGTALRGIAGAIPGGSTTGSLIQGLGGLLSRGGANANTPANATTNQPTGRAGGVLQDLNGAPSGSSQKSTNAPSNAGANQTNQSPVNELLDLFKRPKKQ